MTRRTSKKVVRPNRYKGWSSTSLLYVITQRNTLRKFKNSKNPNRAQTLYFPSAELMRKHKEGLQAYVFVPDHPWKLLWDMVAFIQIIIQSFAVPFIISFSRSSFYQWRSYTVFLRIFFTVDIFSNFNTGYYQRGVLITQRLNIAKNYMKTLFIPDLLATIPYYFILKLSGYSDQDYFQNQDYQISSLILLQLFSLLRLLRYRKYIYQIEKLISSPSNIVLMQSFNFLVIALVFIHWFACIQHYSHQKQKTFYPNTQTRLDYVWFLYSSVLTMTSVGYENFLSGTENQYIISIFAMIISSFIFGQIIGGIQNVLQKFSATDRHFIELFANCKDLKKKSKLPYPLFIRMYRYIRYLRQKNKENLLQQSSILQELSQPINQQIFNHTRVHILKHIVYFSQYRSSFLRLLGYHLMVNFYAPQDKIFTQNQNPECIYFIQEGTVNIYHQETGTIYKELERNGKFGELGFFTGLLRTASAQCNSFAQILSLDRFTFNEILQTKPVEKEKTSLMIRAYKNYNVEAFGIRCYMCHSSQHVARDCRRFVCFVDKEEIIQKSKNRKNKVGKQFNPHYTHIEHRKKVDGRINSYSRSSVTSEGVQVKKNYPYKISVMLQIQRLRRKEEKIKPTQIEGLMEDQREIYGDGKTFLDYKRIRNFSFHYNFLIQFLIILIKKFII